MLKDARLSRLCVLSLDSWTACLAVWITGAQHTVLKTSLLIASAGNDAQYYSGMTFPGYKYLLLSPLGAISHLFSSSLSCLEFLLSCFLLSTNGGKERHQARALSLHRGKSCGQRRQDSSALAHRRWPHAALTRWCSSRVAPLRRLQ
jgi:hypothetical protein